MSFFKSLAAFFKKGTPGFLPLESDILKEVSRQLGGERSNQLNKRIESISLVQRIDGGREVNAYSMEGGKATFDSSLRLTPENGTHKLASFSFEIPDQGRFKGVAWVVDGQFFSIEFDNPTEHALDHHPVNLKLELRI